jgi:hypothetical protein
VDSSELSRLSCLEDYISGLKLGKYTRRAPFTIAPFRIQEIIKMTRQVTKQLFDQAKAEQFAGQMIDTLNKAAVALMTSIGHECLVSEEILW